MKKTLLAFLIAYQAIAGIGPFPGGNGTSGGGGGGTVWGTITGTLSNQIDLQAALDAKQNSLSVTDTASVDLTLAGSNLSAVVLPAGVDHNSLANLTTGDPHTQYALLSGRSLGQSLFGGTGAKEDLILYPTSNASKGAVVIGSGNLVTGANAIAANSYYKTTGGLPSIGAFGTGTNASILLEKVGNGTAAPQFEFSAAKGSYSGGLPVGVGNILGAISWNVWDGSDFAGYDTAEIYVSAEGTQSNTSSGSKFTILTTDSGTQTQQNRLVIDSLNNIYSPSNASLGDNGSNNFTNLYLGSSLSAGAGTFTVDNTGNLTKIRNVPYVWPSTQGVSSTVLTNNGSGTLSWSAAASSGISSLNGLTAATQLFATGTAGTDFAISSSVATHTFNLPVASAVNTGKLSSTDWSTFNSKQDTVSVSDTASIDLTLSANNISGVVLPAGVDHNSLANLTTGDPHTQYALLAGRSGGQTLTGGTAASNNLILRSTTNGTKGQVYLDETTDSTSITTGVLRVDGGVGIAKNLILGNSLSAGTGTFTVDSTGNLTTIRNVPYSWPSSQGSSGTFLKNTGGVLTWASGSGITSLNGLTTATQVFATGTTGSDFAISSAASTHTFNLPTASASNRGALSSTDWSTFNGKQATISVSDTSSIDLTLSTNNISGVVLPAGVDHNSLANLTVADPHTQYALLAGRSGGQTLTGGTASGNNLVLRSTTNGTKGQVYLDETTDSTTTATGALRVDGGVGIAKNLTTGASVSLGPTSNSLAIHQIWGGQRWTTRTVSTSTVLDTTQTDMVVLCATASSTIGLTLPAPQNGRVITAKDKSGNAETNWITLTPTSGAKIEGVSASKVFYTNFGALTVIADGTDWWVIN